MTSSQTPKPAPAKKEMSQQPINIGTLKGIFYLL